MNPKWAGTLTNIFNSAIYSFPLYKKIWSGKQHIELNHIN